LAKDTRLAKRMAAVISCVGFRRHACSCAKKVLMTLRNRSMGSNRFRPALLVWSPAAVVLAFGLSAGCANTPSPSDTRLNGDWDYYVMLGAAPNGGFGARRRMGFAHFGGPSAKGAWLKRRSGAPLYEITRVTAAGDNIAVSLDDGREIVAVVKGDSIEGRI